MSRHRNVRSMNYQDEYDGYDDVYGHSVEDDFPMSPSSAQYIFDRTDEQRLASYMGPDGIPEEEEEDSGSGDEESPGALAASMEFKKPDLNETDQARLNSCLEEMHNILGDSTPEHVMIDAVLKNEFDYEKALNALLVQQDVPKPQRQPRSGRRNRAVAAGNIPIIPTEPALPSDVLRQGNVPVVVTLAAPPKGPKKVAEGAGDNKKIITSGKTAKSGFTPDKDPEDRVSPEQDAIEAVRRELNLTDIERPMELTVDEDEGAEGSTSFSTPRKTLPLDLTATPKSSAKRKDPEAMRKEYEKRKADGKDFINLVVIGHVDAGKSTLMGHVLFQLGFVNKKTMHKFEQESKKIGKASFAFAWVLDETEEERSRGVTMDIAQTRFETDTKIVTLLDAPGHKDFIPNMITGAAQADVAVLVVNATRGEFETGFEAGGQTREHAMLIRSLGVSQLVVAVNKMDTVEWDQARFEEITKKLRTFLKQAGFRDSDLTCVPCSGLNGENLTKPATDPNLTTWYKGSTLIDGIDSFKAPERPVDKPMRMCVSDVFKGMGSGISVSGTIQSGSVQTGDKLLIMPQGETGTVKSVNIDDSPEQFAFAGDNAVLVLTGVDIINIGVGSILCDINQPICATSRIQARVVIFNIGVPLTRGFPVVFHYQAMSEQAHIRKLISQLHKSTGEVVRKKPRCLTKNSSAMIELELNRPVCIELYKDFKDLGRFMLRSGGTTIAAGLVTELLDSRGSKAAVATE